ncbi:MAG TPA: hypothetical protein VFP72_12530 [Kineosporiaceae bacterium]|nr:hypothetical protein [Kineosporiaceae bacterium]
MTPVLIGLLAAIVLALVVVGVVAYPHLRAGAPLLSPEGERLAREARQRAQGLVGGAAEAIVNRDRSGNDGTARPAPVMPPVADTRVVWASPPPVAKRPETGGPGPAKGAQGADLPPAH